MDAFSASLSRLLRRDVLDMEQQLRSSLTGVLSFTGHAVYFPQDEQPKTPVWLEDEGTLLLPLWQERPDLATGPASGPMSGPMSGLTSGATPAPPPMRVARRICRTAGHWHE